MAKLVIEKEVSTQDLQDLVLEAIRADPDPTKIRSFLFREKKMAKLSGAELAEALGELYRSDRFGVEFEGPQSDDQFLIRFFEKNVDQPSAQDERME